MSEPTPRPWRLEPERNGDAYWLSAETGPLTVHPATFYSLPDAQLALQAVNAHDALVAALKEAEQELLEAADKMHVLGLNHPGGTRWLDEDKEFMAQLSDRFSASGRAIRATIALARGEKP
jgi:hypothetical protein